MTRLTRTAAFVLAVVLIVAGLLLGLGQFYLPGPFTLTAYNGQQFIFSHLAATDELINGIIAICLVLLGVFLLAAELFGPPSRQQLPVQGLNGAAVTVDRQGAEERLTTVLQQVPGVQRADVRVRHERNSASVRANLVSDADQPVPPLSEQAQALIGHTLEHDLGLLPGAVRIQVRLARPRQGKDSATAPI